MIKMLGEILNKIRKNRIISNRTDYGENKKSHTFISGQERHPKFVEAIKDVRELSDQEELSIKSQSELTKRQQELLDDLKHVYSWQHSHAWDLFYYLVEKNTQMFDEETINNFMSMSEDESLEVQIIFSQWVLSPDEVIENALVVAESRNPKNGIFTCMKKEQ